MAWTTPKTWVNQDPLNESNMNTFVRDNQLALRAQTEDAAAKLADVYPAYQNPRLFRAVIGINADVSLTSRSLTTWHAKCKLTFTPKTDEVLFGVQLTMYYNYRYSQTRQFAFGLQKGGTNVALTHTDVLTGNVGSDTDLAVLILNHRGANAPFFVHYQVPVAVTRDAEVTISPTVRALQSSVTYGLDNPTVMILTALDVGNYE